MKPFYILLLLTIAFKSNAQVNGYARVSNISSTTLTISSSNEVYGTFTAGSQLIIMQMQDNVIGSNTSDNSSFGNLSSINSAGFYEIAVISSVTRSSGALIQIVINSPLANTYNINSNSSVHVITYPVLGTNGYTTASNIKALAWNGSYGGVVAFRVLGTLTLNHNISADSAGFRGGSLNDGNAGSCISSEYRLVTNQYNGNKGEGIYRATNTSYAAGRGKILNGGGGGNSHNGGGGGGANFTSGGEGGKGYGCSSNAGGLGGIALNTFISADRVFAGGGGGAGEANNFYNTAGGHGGGIILIKATEIRTTGSGAALKISANGQTSADVGNDGAGGGGAGGSVVLNVQTWNITASKTLTISADGGGGGNVTDAAAHGGGAGGGQGAVIFSTAVPTTNITTSTLNGRGGRNYAGGTFADNATGSDHTGIMNSSFSVLPVKLISFNGTSINNQIKVEWKCINEESVSHYEVQRSTDANTFTKAGIISSKNNKESAQYYYFNEGAPGKETVYYRLLIYDKDGQFRVSDVLVVKKKEEGITMSLVPNPVKDVASIHISSETYSSGHLRIINSYGSAVYTKPLQLNPGQNTIQLNRSIALKTGTYQVFVTVNNKSYFIKMLVQR